MNLFRRAPLATGRLQPLRARHHEGPTAGTNTARLQTFSGRNRKSFTTSGARFGAGFTRSSHVAREESVGQERVPCVPVVLRIGAGARPRRGQARCSHPQALAKWIRVVFVPANRPRRATTKAFVNEASDGPAVELSGLLRRESSPPPCSAALRWPEAFTPPAPRRPSHQVVFATVDVTQTLGGEHRVTGARTRLRRPRATADGARLARACDLVCALPGRQARA